MREAFPVKLLLQLFQATPEELAALPTPEGQPETEGE